MQALVMSLKLFDLLPQSSMLLFEVTVKMIEAGGLEADIRRNLEAQKASKSP